MRRNYRDHLKPAPSLNQQFQDAVAATYRRTGSVAAHQWLDEDTEAVRQRLTS